MQNSLMLLTFPVLGRNNFFWVNLVQKIKIVSLNLNLVPTIIYKIFETNSSFHVI